MCGVAIAATYPSSLTSIFNSDTDRISPVSRRTSFSSISGLPEAPLLNLPSTANGYIGCKSTFGGRAKPAKLVHSRASTARSPVEHA